MIKELRTGVLILLTLGIINTKASQPLEDFSSFGIGLPQKEEVTILRGTLSHGSYTPITISQQGVYRLAGAISNATNQNAITISANNVTLDLDGNTVSGGATGIMVTGDDVTIKNGTVTGMSATGIALSENKNAKIEQVDVISSPTGFLLSGGGSHILTNCRALKNTQAGFSLVASSTNNLFNCQALNQQGARDVYGFIANTGRYNLFQSCQTIDARSTTTHTANGIYLGDAELYDKIITCKSSDIHSTYTAYGIFAAASAVIIPDINIDNDTITINSVDWSPDGKYFATGDASTVKIYLFTGSSLQLITTLNPGAATKQIAWSPQNTLPYRLAVLTDTFPPKLTVYTFSNNILTTSTATPGTVTVNTFGWSTDGTYIATGENPSNLVVYASNDLTTNIDSFNNSTGARTISWRPGQVAPYSIAIGAGTLPELRTYTFDGATIATQNAAAIGISIDSVSWSPNGNYLGAATSSSWYIYNPTLASQIATAAPGDTLTQIGWKATNTEFAVASGPSNTYLYSFNGTSATLIDTKNHGAQVNSLAWPHGGAYTNYLGIGGQSGTDGYEARIYTFGAVFPAGHTITNNIVNLVTSSYLQGVGVSADSTQNYVAQNTSCNNDINYKNVQTAYLDSQANARGVDNVDCSLTTSDEVSQIRQEAWSIESKAEVISSKIDILSLPEPCAATVITTDGIITGKTPLAITAPTVLADSGYYCLAQDITTTVTSPSISITGTTITLDLNGYTIKNGATGILVTGNDVTIRNGTIADAAVSGLTLQNNRNCRIEHVDVINTPTGFLLDNSGANILTDCRALQSNSAGFSLVASSTNSIFNCQAANQLGANDVYGFIANHGRYNVFQSCATTDLQTTTTIAGHTVSGFYLGDDELYDKILSCKAFDIQTTSSTFATAPATYGIFTAASATLIPDILLDNNSTVNSVDWSPDGKFFALGDANGAVKIYAFDGAALSIITTVTRTPQISTLAWNPQMTNPYRLAVLDQAVTNNMALYTFTNGTLSLDMQTTISSASTFGWASDGSYIAANPHVTELQIYSGATLALIGTSLTMTPTGNINSISWRPVHTPPYSIAVGTSTANTVKTATFYKNNLTQEFTTDTAAPISSVAWSANGAYLAAATNTGNTYHIYTPALDQITTDSFGSGAMTRIGWQASNSRFAITQTGNSVGIFSFNGTSATLAETKNYGAQSNTLAWPPGGSFTNYLAVGGTNASNESVIYTFSATIPTEHTITNNLVNQITSKFLTGVGIHADSTTNYVAQNTSCNNDVNYQLVASQYLDSQANARGVDNIDCSLTNQDTVDIINSKLDVLDPCAATPIMTYGLVAGKTPIAITQPAILSDSGAYCLAQDIQATSYGITVTGNSITLDLNGYTIKNGTTGILVTGNDVIIRNGTIINPLDTGITLSGNSNCRIEHVDVLNAPIGFLLDTSGANMLTDCRALNSTGKGFSLVASSTNSLHNCQALNTLGTDDTYGFFAIGGGLNEFVGCNTRATQAIPSVAGKIAAGFRLQNESQSSILNCLADETTITTTNASAYGIVVNPKPLPAGILLDEFAQAINAPGAQINAVAWSPDCRFVAVGGIESAGYHVRVYEYFSFTDTLEEITTARTNTNATVNAVAWSPNGQFLVLGTDDLNNEIKVYGWNGSTLSLLNQQPHGASVLSVAWNPAGSNLVIGGVINSSGVDTSLYSWNGSTLTLIKDQEAIGYANNQVVKSVAFSPDGLYVAIGGHGFTNPNQFAALSVYENTLNTDLANAPGLGGSTSLINSVNTTSWLQTGSGYYLAAGGTLNNTPVYTRVYQFTSTAPGTGTLTTIADASPDHGAQVNSVAWSTDGTYLVVGGDPSNGQEVSAYQFSAANSTLIKTADASPAPGAAVYSVSWGPCGYVAAGGATANAQQVLLYGDLSGGNCRVIHNLASGTTTLNGAGVGIKVNSVGSYVAQNTSCNNDINYQDVETKYLSSQATADGVDNVDCSFPESGANTCDATVINTSGTIIGKAALSITAPAVLSDSGAYCLAQDISASNTTINGITITGNTITLDLNGYTIKNGTTGILVTGNDVTIKNGTVADAIESGIKLLNTKNCHVESVDVVNTPTGFLLENSGANVLTECRALQSRNAGFSLVASSTNSIFNCQVANQLGDLDVYGFIANGGQYNLFNGCQAMDIRSTTTHAANGIYLGDSEFYDKIIKCKIYDIQSTGTAYGIFGSLFTAADINIANGATVKSIGWSPDGKYFALGDANYNLKVYSFNGRALTFITSITRFAIISKIAWSPTDIAPYSIALIDQQVSSNFAKYSFNGTTLTPITRVTASSATTLGWAADGQHLAVNPSTNTLQAYDSSLNPIGSPVTAGNTINAIDWSPTYTWLIAIGTSSANTIITYTFNGATLTQKDQSASFPSNIITVSWSPNGNYLGAGDGSGTWYIVNPTLSATIQQMSIGQTITAFGWRSDTAAFAVAGTEFMNTPIITIYSFDGGPIPTLITTKAPNAIASLAWPQSGSFMNYLAAGGATNSVTAGTIYTLGSSLPTQHTITNNLVNQVTAAMGGVGIVADSSVNYVAQNTSCNNDINFQGVAPAYLDSQANARGVDNIDCSLTTPDEVTHILQETWSIESKAEIISSKIDTLGGSSGPCEATPIIASGIITGKMPLDISQPSILSDSGYYCLAQDITTTVTSPNISIIGNTITLDLNGYTVKNGTTGILVTGNDVTIRNGTIADAIENGIQLLNNKNCRIESVDVINTPTGFLLENSGANLLTDCRAVRASLAGFSLVASSTNSIFNCQALNQQSARDIYGFIANGGQYNLFNGCQAMDIRSTTTHSANGIYLGDSEFYDKIIKCKIYDIQSTGTAYGIFGSLFTAADINIANGVTVNSIDWSPDGKYFALGDANGNLKVYSFNGRALTFITSINRSANIPKIAWSPTDSAPYSIALIDQNSNLVKYSFNGTTLTQIAQVTPYGATTLGWAADGQHLAVNTTANTLQAYDSSLNPIGSSVTAGNTINAIDWSSTPTYRLALGTATTIETYHFNGTGFTLAHSTAVGINIPSVDWSPHGDYLAAAENQFGNSLVAIFAPDLGGGSPIAYTSIDNAGNTPQVAWATDNVTLAAVTTNGTTGICSFNGTTLTLEQTKSHGAQLNTLAWPQSGSYTGYLAVAGVASGGYEGIIYALGSSLPTQHTITNNLVNQVTAAMGGVGIVADSSVNYVAQNTSCNNDINFQGVAPAYLDSQANARGVDNVDCTLTTADSVEVIASTVDIINSKLDVLDPCAATPITTYGLVAGKMPIAISQPAILSDSGAYCLAQDIQATSTTSNGITITGNTITLDLNGYTVKNGTTGILVTGNDVTIRNGTIINPLDTGITLSGNSNCRIESVDVINTPTGFLLENSGANLLTDCRAVRTSKAGFSLVASSTNSIFNCQVANQLGDLDVYGFIANSGQYNVFQSCQAMDVRSTTTHQASGFYLGDNEFYDKITKCKAYDIQATSTAYGIFATASAVSIPDINIANGNTIDSVDWSPDGKFFALGDQSGNLKVYSFNGRALTFITAINPASSISKIAWHPTSTAPYYIAFITTFGTNFLNYSFNGSSLSLVAQTSVSSATTLGWSADGSILAVNSNGNQLQAYNPTTLTTIGSSASPGGTIKAIDWSSATNLAIGTNSSIETYNWNGSTFTQTSIYTSGVSSVNTVDWAPNGNYLAAGYSVFGINSIVIFAPNVTGGPLASSPVADSFPVNQVGWAANNTSVAAVTNNGSSNGDTYIYSFNNPTLTLIDTKPHGAQLNTLAWPQGGDFTGYLAVAGAAFGGYEGTIYALGALVPSNHTITNNLVNQVATAAEQGVGIKADSSVNYVAQNTSCDNDINYQNVQSQYLDSQANARGVDNVDCSLTTPDTVEVINSKIDKLTPCAPTPLFQPISSRIDLLTTDNYCFATDIAATVSIQAGNVSLCLNNRTLTGQLIVDAAAALVSNGAIYALHPTDATDAANPALAISTRAPGAQINNLTITCEDSTGSLAGRVGMKVWGSTAYIKDCSIQSGSGSGSGQPGGNAIEIMAPCQSARIRETDIVGTGSGIGTAAGNGIQLDRGCANVEIRGCTFMSTGTGNSATGGLAIYDDSAAASRTDLYSSVIYDNFAYSTGNVPPYYIKNKGSAGISNGTNLIVGAPGNYANVYVPTAQP